MKATGSMSGAHTVATQSTGLFILLVALRAFPILMGGGGSMDTVQGTLTFRVPGSLGLTIFRQMKKQFHSHMISVGFSLQMGEESITG